MINSIRIEFKKIDKNTWSNSEYQVLIKPIDYTEYDDSGFFGPEQTTQYGSLETGLKRIKAAKESIAKAEVVLSFIETNPERWRIVFFLEESKLRHSACLNCIEIYL